MKLLRSAIKVVALITVTATLTTGLMYRLRPWERGQGEARTAEHSHTGNEVTLRWDTPVIQEWITSDGEKLGEYTTTLMEYNDESREVQRNSQFRKEVSDLIARLAQDPKLRGDLVRHGMDANRLDLIARHFSADSETSGPYLTYPDGDTR